MCFISWWAWFYTGFSKRTNVNCAEFDSHLHVESRNEKCWLWLRQTSFSCSAAFECPSAKPNTQLLKILESVFNTRTSFSLLTSLLSLSFFFNGSVVKREMDDNVGLLNNTCNIYCCFISNLEKQLKHKEAKLFMIVFSSVGYHYNFRYRCLSYRGEFGKLKSAG